MSDDTKNEEESEVLKRFVNHLSIEEQSFLELVDESLNHVLYKVRYDNDMEVHTETFDSILMTNDTSKIREGIKMILSNMFNSMQALRTAFAYSLQLNEIDKEVSINVCKDAEKYLLTAQKYYAIKAVEMSMKDKAKDIKDSVLKGINEVLDQLEKENKKGKLELIKTEEDNEFD